MVKPTYNMHLYIEILSHFFPLGCISIWTRLLLQSCKFTFLPFKWHFKVFYDPIIYSISHCSPNPWYKYYFMLSFSTFIQATNPVQTVLPCTVLDKIPFIIQNPVQILLLPWSLNLFDCFFKNVFMPALWSFPNLPCFAVVLIHFIILL